MIQLDSNSTHGFDRYVLGDQYAAAFDQYYNSIISPSTAMQLSFTASLNNITGAGAYAPTLMKILWHKLYDKLAHGYLSLKANKWSTNVTVDNNTSLGTLKGWMNYGDTPPNPDDDLQHIALHTIYVTRNITATFDRLDAFATELNRLTNLEAVLTSDIHHKVRLYQDKKGKVIYFTNKYDPETTLWRFLGMAPILFPFVQEVIIDPANKEIKDMFQGFFESDGELLEKILINLLSNIEKELSNKKLQDMETVLKSFSDKYANTCRTKVDQLRQQVENHYRAAAQYD
jgi:hypothetical protein